MSLSLRAKRERDIKATHKLMTENISLKSMQGLEQGRLDRALDIALSDDLLVKYQTTWTTCLCPDSGYRGIHYICKHRLALMMRNFQAISTLIWLEEPLYYSEDPNSDPHKPS